MKGKKGRSRTRSNSNISNGSNNERLSHKEALKKKYDVITVKAAENICVTELPLAKSNGRNTSRDASSLGRPVGLINLGNTCFLNSTLQCLMHTIPLKNYLLNEIHSKRCRIKGPCLFCSLESFINQCESANRGKLAPRDIVNNLKKSWKQYRFGRQEDSHEFLVMFIQGILRASFGNSPKLVKKYEHLTMVYRIFAGKLRSQIKCLSCSYCSDSFEPFLALSLDISKGNTFEECIRNFCKAETLDGANKYKCGG